MFIIKKNFFLMLILCAMQKVQIFASEIPLKHPDCPVIDDINNPRLLPYPGDCTKYYSCLNGLAYAQKCPGIFHFSRLASRCEYPEKAMCLWQIPPASVATTTSPAIAETTTKATNMPMPEFIYQLYPYDCNRYLKCEAMTCPTNYHWNPQQQKCDFPHLAQCPFRPTSTLPPPIVIPTAPTAPPTEVSTFTTPTTPTTPSVLPPTSPGVPVACMECTHWCMGQGHIYLPYPGDCRKFIQCNGLAFIHNCPNDLLWNDREKTCDTFCILNNE